MVKTLESLEQRRLRFGSLGALDFLIDREKGRLAELGVALPLGRLEKTGESLFAGVVAPPFEEQIALARSTGHFHTNWYVTTYRGVGDLGKNPIAHYLREGSELGFNPGKNFDTQFYLQMYPDAAASGLNPLVHFALYGKKAGYTTKPKKIDPRKQINVIRNKLLSMGFTERPLAELTEIATIGDDPIARALAARELALWHMRAKTVRDYRIALAWIARSRLNAPDLDFRTKLSTVELLCHLHLNQHDEGRAAFDRAWSAGESAPNLLLARVNFDQTPEQRVDWINKVLAHYGIEPVTLLPDDSQPPYDRLTCAVPLPKVTDGPKVTVLIAAYDAAQMLPTALRSLQEQTWQNLEIIVLDDCSPTLDTVRVAERFAATDPRIQIVRMAENGGAYVARNRGLDMATGEFVTLHDADDWIHPLRIETQALFLQGHRDTIGCTTQQARVDSSLSFKRWTGEGHFIIKNTSSFMFRRLEMREHFGYWDTARFSSDQELIRRIKHKFGNNAVIDINTGPFAFQRDSGSSIVADEALGINGFLFGARKEYYDAQRQFHKNAEDLRFAKDPALRPFPVPTIMRSDRPKLPAAPHFDVIIASEFRMDGGSIESCIQEIRAARSARLLVGIVELYRYDLGNKTRKDMLPVVREEVDGEGVQVVTYGQTVTCDLLVIRYPPVLQDRQRYVPNIRARAIKVVVNQPPMSDYSAKGVRRYQLERCANNLRHYFGQDAVWHPNGPMVREALVRQHGDELHHINLSPDNWDNIIHLPDWQRGPRSRGPADRLRIGRHSRDSYVKWPATAEDIMAAYPVTEDVEVHIMGGARTPSELIGYTPGNWVVHGFNALPVRDFLSELDVFVFFAHPDWVESFPRVVLEAMAVGLPVILSESHRPLFGDRALYATPQTALDLARRLHADPAAYDAQVQKAWDYLEEHYSYAMHARRLRASGVRERTGHDHD